MFGLTQQMRRAAVSIPSNLAEGAARGSSKEYCYFISIARGSLAELTTQIQIAQMLGYLDKHQHVIENTDYLGRLLTGLHKKWKVWPFSVSPYSPLPNSQSANYLHSRPPRRSLLLLPVSDVEVITYV